MRCKYLCVCTVHVIQVKVCFEEDKEKVSASPLCLCVRQEQGEDHWRWVERELSEGKRGETTHRWWELWRGTQTVLNRSHSSKLQSDSVWLGVTSESCFMSQAGGHMIAQHEGRLRIPMEPKNWKAKSQQSNSSSNWNVSGPMSLFYFAFLSFTVSFCFSCTQGYRLTWPLLAFPRLFSLALALS